MRLLALNFSLTSFFFSIISVQFATAADSPTLAKFGPKWTALIGEWKGETDSGASTGACGFHFDLSSYVIVRTNHAEILRGAPPHDDLMILSPEPSSDKAKAMYFDNEGHVIDYAAEWSPDGNTLTFASKPAPGPQFRLTYRKISTDSFNVVFEMSPPGQTTYKPYATGKIRRASK